MGGRGEDFYRVLRLCAEYNIRQRLSVSGLDFQKRIYKVHSVRWIHLRSRSKAYLAERMIYTAKVRLQQCLDGNYPDLNWIQFLKPFYDDYNRQFVKTHADSPHGRHKGQ